MREFEAHRHRGDRRRPGGPVGRLSPGPARRVRSSSWRPTRGSATPGGSAGTRCGCSRRRGSTGSTACRSRPAPRASRPRTRWPTTSRPTRRASRCRSGPASGCDRVVAAEGDRYVVTAGDRRFEADNVVVAMADFQRPRVPGVRRRARPRHRAAALERLPNPAQLRPGGVLIVGRGNSGAEIALEVVRAGHQTLRLGPSTGARAVPDRRAWRRGWSCARLLFRVVFHRLLTAGHADRPQGPPEDAGHRRRRSSG